MLNQKSFETGLAAEAHSAWYLVATHAGKERLAVMQLRMQGFVTYLPMRAPLKAGAAARPLFPGYAFVQVDLQRPGWRSVYATIGVKDVVSSGVGEARRPRAMPHGLVPGLMALEREGLIVVAAQGEAGPRPAAAYKVGDKVKVAMGAERVIDAVVAEPVDGNRATVLISMLGRDSKATVSLAAISRPSAVAVQGQAPG